MAILSKPELRARLEHALHESEWKFLIVEPIHPFLFRAYSSSDAGSETVDIRVYIWNCTHGGGPRSADEYRVQLTGSVPHIHDANEKTLILGWHADAEVFVGFDIAHHLGQGSSSPSIQVKLSALERAAKDGFSAYERGNQEIAVAFRPEFIVDYARQRDALHKSTAGITGFVERLAEVTKLEDGAIASEPDKDRREVLVTLKKKYRAADFRDRVLTAYKHHCAMCGSQLRLVEAAHILPVPVPGSDDTTNNGVALCVLHHRAFDASLISFDEGYDIQISKRRLSDLQGLSLDAGAKEFCNGVYPSLALPDKKDDYPAGKFILAGRDARGWIG
jgi:putative restriction endonuclease